MGIENVDFAGISNATTWSPNSNYNDYSSTVSPACVTAGSTYNVTVQVAGPWYDQCACVWIDWDQNNSFDASEIIASQDQISPGSSMTISYTIPSNQSAGTYKMRVVSDYMYYSPVYGYSYNPCSNYYGEFEDYSVNVVGTSGTDASLTRLLSPSAWAIGNNTLTVRMYNLAGNTITDYDVNYSFNGGSTVTESVSNASWTTCGYVDYTFNTAMNISTGGTYSLDLWVSNPNGQNPDDLPGNDKISLTICTGISGNYTIDGSQNTSGSNFNSFSDAVTALNNCGISGPVTFTVAAGTYTENVTINEVNGNSSTNTITFDGQNAANCTLQSSAVATFKLNGVDYVLLKI
jgi:hypothetical protein